ncbi:hypothetical protein GCT13_31555 [Paraburkholderia sp. CNPSo 3157]|uniref:Uncharacterized protein n=1 Tax=Paraburkholderia franconis TaxID=2654983 RepID=A0A7X1NG49_9BURK|nr:hypothetical protein [Paraburkholderia franconis]MPW21292.1 hypothetical protein [Paraburkholderia franconis]
MTYHVTPVFSGQNTVSSSSSLDDGKRTELLCHLVAEQLLSRAIAGIWLTPESLVECIQRWARMKGVSPGWLDGTRIGQLSEQLAFDLWKIQHLRGPTRITSFFDVQGMLDNDSPFVKRMCAVCEARLLAHGMVEARSWRSEVACGGGSYGPADRHVSMM